MQARIALFAVLAASVAASDHPGLDRYAQAGRLLEEIMESPESSIPRSLLAKAECVALIPGVKKAAFVVGGRFGKGFLQCRHGESWSGPSALRLEGGSFGLQIGASSTDVVLLVMNEQGRKKLLASKFTLGADAAVAGGPVGRSAQAQTDAQMQAKILSYSRSRGVFAGISLQGATLRPDNDANAELYGREVAPEDVVSGRVPPPAFTHDVVALLAKYSAAQPEDETEPESGSEPVPVRSPGVLGVTSAPGLAEVEIDADFNGLTPRKKQLSPGEYKVRISKAGFVPLTKTVVVEAGQTVELHAELSAIEVEAAEPEPKPTVDAGRQAKRTPPASNSRIRVVGIH